MTTSYQSITLPFPQGLIAHWQPQDSPLASTISPPLTDWLNDSASLTKRLSNLSQQFAVQVLSQTHSALSPQEQALFTHTEIQCREVLLLCNGQAQVYARTLIPADTLAYANSQLKSLGNQSLGEILFNDPSMRRSHIDICHFEPSSSLGLMSQQLSLPPTENIWGRRSMFYLQDYPLSVTEFFLPRSFAYSTSLL